MTLPLTTLIPGDTLTLTIKGTITDAAKADTPRATTMRIFRPGGSPGLFAAIWAPRDLPELSPAIKVDAVFEPDCEISYDISSRWRNGVHIDAGGRYWMRRPDGWYEMTVASTAVPVLAGSQFTPPGVQRLKEDKAT